MLWWRCSLRHSLHCAPQPTPRLQQAGPLARSLLYTAFPRGDLVLTRGPAARLQAPEGGAAPEASSPPPLAAAPPPPPAAPAGPTFFQAMSFSGFAPETVRACTRRSGKLFSRVAIRLHSPHACSAPALHA
jgi:hypothetical protein